MANNNKNKKNTNSKKNNSAKKANTNKNVNNAKKVAEKANTKEIKKVTTKEEIKVEKIETPKEEVVKVVKEKKTFKLTPKQRDLILILLVVVLLVVAIVLTSAKKIDIELPIALEGEAGYTEITYAEYDEKLNTEAPFLVVIKRDGCSFCEQYDPILKEVADEYALPINYINMSNLTEDEYNSLASSNSYLRKNQWGTPTTLFMYGSEVVDSIGQYVDKDTLVEFVKENFVVGE